MVSKGEGAEWKLHFVMSIMMSYPRLDNAFAIGLELSNSKVYVWYVCKCSLAFLFPT